MADSEKKKCFVVMGFGEKVDFATGRTLDLDKTYRLIIKKAVEDAGLECIRADDIIHAGIIDKPMYELLYGADVVVADLSTSNANAIYELGVRHALKPNTTIIIAEKQFKFPFDIGHLVVRPYEHLGKGIDGEEADRARGELKEAIVSLVNKTEVDSPVYTFLPTLSIPSLLEKAIAAGILPATEIAKNDESATLLTDMFQDAKKVENWVLAISLLNKLLAKRSGDNYLKQQLALATYKSKQPDLQQSLLKAKEILNELNPYQTTDPETLGLWGAIHKRLWELNLDKADLEEAIWAHEKGFIVKNDFYNGINYAFLLNVRASVSTGDDVQTDMVLAERVRRKVLVICNAILNNEILPRVTIDFIEDAEQKFWLMATIVEAYIGLGETEKALALKNEISNTAPHSWMINTMNEQLEKLNTLLKNSGKNQA